VIPETLEGWQERREELRELLWELLLGNQVPETPEPSHAILLEGEAVAARVAENWAYYYQFRPEDRERFEHITYRYAGEETWDTFLVSYPGWPGEPPQQGILRVPHERHAPLPAVLCLHGHAPGCAFGKEEMDYLAVPLAAKGFVTLSPDTIRFGDRRVKSWDEADLRDHQGMSFVSERELAMASLLKGQTLQGMMVWEFMRAVEMLGSLPYVDAARIGSVGMSMGGINTFWLAAMDERVAAAAEVCGVSSYRVWAHERTINALFCYVPHILRFTDVGEIGGLIAPRPFLMVDAAQDGFFPAEGVHESQQAIRAIYDLYGADTLEQVVQPGGHVFTESEIAHTLDWLDARLGG
jgi:dienelactone hydrolase